MSDGLPRKAKVGTRTQSVSIDPRTYFIGKRMESAGVLRPGQALMLAATLPTKQKAKGKRK